MSWFTFHFQDFSYSFLSILFEGIPFLLLGSVLSGIIEVFVSAETLARLLPKRMSAAIVVSGLLGAIFPMCECGSVAVIRRFIRKGLPVPCAVTYMLAAPIVNPIVAISTFAAFRGQSPWTMVGLRLLLGFLIAVLVGFVARQFKFERWLQPDVLATIPQKRKRGLQIASSPLADNEIVASSGRQRMERIVRTATSDFLDVTFFLVIGAAIAAVFNTAVSQAIIQPMAQSPSLATFALMLLALLLSLCSTTDAFVAASFVTFPAVAKLAFLVIGPMFDLKLFFLYGVLFKRRLVIALGVGLFAVIALICIQIFSALQYHL